MSADQRPDVGYLTHPGRVRQRNEDQFALPPDWSEEALAGKGRLYLVADGMGGHLGGQRASQMAAQRIVQEYYRDPSPELQHSLARAIRVVNAEIHQEAARSPELHNMGTTVTAVVVSGQELLVANVGDSRAYLIRNGISRQLTRDHSLIAHGLRAGIIGPDEVGSHPYRGQITRALGPSPDVQPDFFHERLQPGDILLLCSDGLSDEVEDQQIAAIVTQGRTAQEAANRLVAQANRNGGRDNMTALVIGIDGRRVTGATGFPSWFLPLASGLVALGVVLAILIWFYQPTPVTTPSSTVIAQATGATPETFPESSEPSPSLLPPTATGEPGSEPFCGDGICNDLEDAEGCPDDCPPSSEATQPTAAPSPPVPTTTMKPSPTPTPTVITARPATATSRPLYPAPVLLAPEQDAPISLETVTLEWRWDCALAEDEHFDVRVWRDGQEHLGVAWADSPSYPLHRPSLPERLTDPEPGGIYYWAVAVIRGEEGEVTGIASVESSCWTFVWELPPTKRPTPPMPTDEPTPVERLLPTAEPRPTESATNGPGR